MGRAGVAGYVLAGGRSHRMGRDKALLRLGRTTLLERVVSLVREAADVVTVVGPPERYARLGLAVIPDLHDGLGPIGGLHAALSHSHSEWNLVVACDMPSLQAGFLSRLVGAATVCDRLCLAPVSDRGIEPLCAVWRRSCLEFVERAIQRDRFKMQDLIGEIDAATWPAAEASELENINTPLDWAAHE